MTTPIPKNRHGKTDWTAVFAAASPGQRLRIPKTLAGAAYTAAKTGPFQIASKGHPDGTVDLIIGPPHPPKATPAPEPSGPFGGLSAADVVHKITAAHEQIEYWTRYRAAQTDKRDRIAAGARVQLWTMQLAALRRYLNLLCA
jgi:hypothetical protein